MGQPCLIACQVQAATDRDAVLAVLKGQIADLAAALQPLRTAGYAGWMIVETANSLDYARQGYAHLPKTAQHLGFKIMSEEAA